MAGVSWVAGTTSTFVTSATSINATTPAGLADGDVLIAFVMARSTLTPPAGWTLVTSQACVSGGTTQTLYMYRKTTVTAGNSSTVYTWSQTSANRMGVTYAAIRSESGVGVVRATTTANVNDTSTATITPGVVTADRGLEIFLTSCTTVVTSSPATPTPPTGFTRSSGGSASDYRIAAAYRTAVAGQASSGNWVMFTSPSTNGLAAVMARVTDIEEDMVLAEEVALALTDDTSGSTYGDVLGEALGLRDITGEFSEAVLADTIGALDVMTPIVAQLATAVDTASIRVSEIIATRAYALTASDTVSIALAQVENMGVIMRETLGMSASTVAGALIFRQALADLTRITDAVSAGRPVSLADAIGLAVTTQIAQAAQVMQALGLTDTFSPTTTYNLTVTQQVALADALRRFLGANAADGLGLTATWVEQAYATGTLADTIALAETVTPRMILRATLADGVDITPEQAVSMIFAGVIEEGVELSAAYISPNGAFSAWAMNARTGAVSEYTNFDFNSFARQGNTYLGASSSGLYELVGDDDAGTDIVARLKSGYLQFGGTHLSRLKAAYIAVRGEGDFVLKIETGDGSSYSYAVTTRNMRSTKVHMGKGQRARYFSFELISTGQDFDLDTLEFVPITVQRRV